MGRERERVGSSIEIESREGLRERESREGLREKVGLGLERE